MPVARKKTASKNYSVRRTKRNRLMLVSNCAACVKKKSGFVKNQDIRGLLSKSGSESSIKLCSINW